MFLTINILLNICKKEEDSLLNLSMSDHFCHGTNVELYFQELSLRLNA